MFDWSLLKMRTSFLLAPEVFTSEQSAKFGARTEKNEKEVFETKGKKHKRGQGETENDSLIVLYDFKDQRLNHGTRFEWIH